MGRCCSGILRKRYGAREADTRTKELRARFGRATVPLFGASRRRERMCARHARRLAILGGLMSGVVAGGAPTSAAPYTTTGLTHVTGASLLAGCLGDHTTSGTNFVNSQVEPWVAVDRSDSVIEAEPSGPAGPGGVDAHPFTHCRDRRPAEHARAKRARASRRPDSNRRSLHYEAAPAVRHGVVMWHEVAANVGLPPIRHDRSVRPKTGLPDPEADPVRARKALPRRALDDRVTRRRRRTSP
jgi:hypothetical protein